MGILSGKDLFSSKYLTAVVINAEYRGFVFPIRYPVGDFFIAQIEGQLYVFKITDKIITYRHTAVKSFRFIIYHTSHWAPLSPENTRELEIILTKNSLPKVNKLLQRTFKMLGEREKTNFEEHNITELIGQILDAKSKNPIDAKNIATYLKNLEVEKIITPVKNVADFIQEDLLPVNPAFLGTVIGQWIRAETVRKKVMNAPTTGKIPWLKLIILLSIVTGITVIVIWAVQNDIFSSIIPRIGEPTSQDIMQQYPTPEALKAAIDRGEVDYDSLPPDIKKMIEGVEAPVVTTP